MEKEGKEKEKKVRKEGGGRGGKDKVEMRRKEDREVRLKKRLNERLKTKRCWKRRKRKLMKGKRLKRKG